MKKKAPEKPASNHPCAAGNCPQPGEYKAPRSRWEQGEYQYLCLEHVREFNRAWDYFEGWSREQIESFSHSVVHGHRPTWSMSARIGGGQPMFTNEKLRESFFRMMGEAPPEHAAKPEPRIKPKVREALSILNLEPGAEPLMIKRQYKMLVKKYHPDVNKDDKAAEEMFKRVTAAYTLLLKTYGTSHED